MTEPIKLPPLPSPFGIVDPVFKRKNPFYDVKDLQDYAMAYATAAIEADRQARGEPVAWGAFYFGGKRNWKLYSQSETEAQIDAYIDDVHRSNDSINSITLRKGPLYTTPHPQQIPEGYKLVPDYKVGMRVKFKGMAYEIFAKGDRPGTFDICLPEGVSGDRWLNVPPDALEMLEAAPEPKGKA